MNEIVKIRLENLINNEIDDVLGNIENRRIWLLESSNKETSQAQLEDLFLDNEYLTALKILKNRIEREDL